jgi:DUF3040 family protein
MLSEAERQRLDAIEQRLERDDPQFVREMRALATGRVRPVRRCLVLGVLLGGGLVLVGVATLPAIAWAGAVLAALCGWLHLILAWVERGCVDQLGPEWGSFYS